MFQFQKSIPSNTARGSLARYIMALGPTAEQAAKLDADLFQGHVKMSGVVYLLELIDDNRRLQSIDNKGKTSQ